MNTHTAIVPAPKKRMTLNSREASMSLEDVLAARSALELYESNTNDKEDTLKEEEEEQIESPPVNKRKRELIEPEVTAETPSSTVSSVGHDESFIIKEPSKININILKK